jgi:hypothetical protein
MDTHGRGCYYVQQQCGAWRCVGRGVVHEGGVPPGCATFPPQLIPTTFYSIGKLVQLSFLHHVHLPAKCSVLFNRKRNYVTDVPLNEVLSQQSFKVQRLGTSVHEKRENERKPNQHIDIEIEEEAQYELPISACLDFVC